MKTNEFLQGTQEDIVTLFRNDIFFLDANLIVAYLNETDPRHDAVLKLIESFIHQEKLLCLNNTVVHEVIHALARTFYSYEMMQIDDPPNHLTSKNQQEILSRHSRNFLKVTKPKRYFTPEQVKACNQTLRIYNTKAIEKFYPFLNDYCILLHSSSTQVELALYLSKNIPLHSADAMIAASAIHHNTTEPVTLITLDRDLCSLPDIPVYFFDAHTNAFTISKMTAPHHTIVHT